MLQLAACAFLQSYSTQVESCPLWQIQDGGLEENQNGEQLPIRFSPRDAESCPCWQIQDGGRREESTLTNTSHLIFTSFHVRCSLPVLTSGFHIRFSDPVRPPKIRFEGP